jgi:hypothetical protein
MPVTVKVNGTVNSLVHKGSNHVSMATIPDVCKTPSPGGPVPIPYPNISQSATLDKGTSTVKADGGMMIAIKGSEFSLSNGDEAGTIGGVKSSTFIKESTWILYSFDVKMEGQGACRLSDKKFQNHENTADLMGTAGAPVPIGTAALELELQKIADCCNKAVDCFQAKKGNKKRKCTSRGTHKHTCCSEALGRRNYANVASEKQHNLKPACRPDVRVPATGKVSKLYDFKFNCDPVEPYVSERQKAKYKARYGVEPHMIGSQGAANKDVPLSPAACANASKSANC